MILVASLNGYVSRPIAPTRRLALGPLSVPEGRPPGSAAALLSGVAAEFGHRLSPDQLGDIEVLIEAVRLGRRVVQPAARHRLQQDRVGLTAVSYRLIEDRGALRLDWRHGASSPLQALLLALYACQQSDWDVRTQRLAAFGRGLQHRGGPSDAFLRRALASPGGAIATHDADWAIRLLGLQGTRWRRRDIQVAYRRRLVEVHPDQGGSHDDAPERIAALGEARRILIERAS